MLGLLLSLMGITQHTTDTQQRPLTQIRMTISAMIRLEPRGGWLRAGVAELLDPGSSLCFTLPS